MATTTEQAGGFVADANIVHTTFYVWANSQYGLMGISHRVGGPSAGTTLGDIAWFLESTIVVSLQDVVGIPAIFLGARSTIQSPIGSELAGVAISTDIGGAGSTLLPTQTCGIISFKTPKRGPAGRGRVYTPFPGNSASNATTGLPSAGFLSNLSDLATNLGLTYAGESEDGLRLFTLEPVLFHRTTGNYSSIIGAEARPYWGTQKRRGDLGRPNPPVIPL